jgi:hypothetical protein
LGELKHNAAHEYNKTGDEDATKIICCNFLDLSGATLKNLKIGDNLSFNK